MPGDAAHHRISELVAKGLVRRNVVVGQLNIIAPPGSAIPTIISKATASTIVLSDLTTDAIAIFSESNFWPLFGGRVLHIEAFRQRLDLAYHFLTSDAVSTGDNRDMRQLVLVVVNGSAVTDETFRPGFGFAGCTRSGRVRIQGSLERSFVCFGIYTKPVMDSCVESELFLPKSDERLDSCRATRGDVRGEGGDGSEEREHRHVC